MIRLCPNCKSERPLSETLCQGRVDEQVCNWDLSTVAPTSAGAATAQAGAGLRCRQGHQMGPGDVMCLVCGDIPGQTCPPDEATSGPTVISDWVLGKRLPVTSAVQERYLVTHKENGRQAVLTLYGDGSEPDTSVYDVIRLLPRDYVPEILETGRWEGRAFEVAEEFTGGTLSDLALTSGDTTKLRRIVEEIGRALHAFSERGLRHRDLRPGVIVVRTLEPLDLVITGFGSARSLLINRQYLPCTT